MLTGTPGLPDLGGQHLEHMVALVPLMQGPCRNLLELAGMDNTIWAVARYCQENAIQMITI